MEKTGINRIVNFLKKFEFSNKKIEANYSLGIGAIEGSPLSVSRGYSIFVNDGKIKNVFIVDSIRDKDNKEIISTPIILNKDVYFENNKFFKKIQTQIENKEQEISQAVNNELLKNNDTKEETQSEFLLKEKQKNEVENEELLTTSEITKEEDEDINLISSQSAYQMYSILEGAVQRGSGYGLLELKLPIGVKTGTSDKGKDLWTVAIADNLCISVYVGYDTPTETNLFGLQGAFPVVKNILKNIKNIYSIKTKTAPEGLKYVKINLLNGKRTKKPLSKNIIFEIFKKNDDTDGILEEQNESVDEVLDDF